MFELRLAFCLELGFGFFQLGAACQLPELCSGELVPFGCLLDSLLGDIRLCLSCVFLNFTELRRSMGR